MLNQTLSTVIQSLCRIGLGSDNPAFRRQVERLAATLETDGDTENASKIHRILSSIKRQAELQPSKIDVSQAFANTETLTPTTLVPSDKESGTSLAEVKFCDAGSHPFPILRHDIQNAVGALVEEWRNAQKLRDFGVTPVQSCLLYGRPGTGKTLIAHAIAAELGLPLVLARIDGLVSSYLGTTARNIANLFQFANRFRCVLLLDEFDALAKMRDDPHEVGEIKRVVNSILQNLDLRRGKGITIAITNHEQLLDQAVWRRFETRILIPPPEAAARSQIISKYFSPLALQNEDLSIINWLCDGMTGAEIESLANSTKRYLALNDNASLISALRHRSITGTGGDSHANFNKVTEPNEALAKILLKEEKLPLSQRDIAHFLSTNQAQVSRWVKPTSDI